MNKGVVLIQSYCDTHEKKEILIKNISEFKSLGVDIVLTSPIQLDSHIYENVDYFIYDSVNPILWDEKRFIHWKLINEGKSRLETIIPDYGWTVFHQIKTAYNFIKDLNYNHVFIACYDLNLNIAVNNSTFICDIINQKTEGYFTHIKNQENGLEFNPGLIFLSLSAKNAKYLINSFSKEEYIFYSSLIAEEYLKLKLKNVDIENIGNVYDHIHYDGNVFNQSPHKDFNIFVDTEKGFRFYYKVNDINIHQLIINKEIIDISNELFFKRNISFDSIYRFGTFVNDEYISLNHLIKPNMKINRIDI